MHILLFPGVNIYIFFQTLIPLMLSHMSTVYVDLCVKVIIVSKFAERSLSLF